MGGVLVVLINNRPGISSNPKYGWSPGSVVCLHSVLSRSLRVGFCSKLSTQYRAYTHQTTRTPPIIGFWRGPWTIVDQHYQDCTHIWVSRWSLDDCWSTLPRLYPCLGIQVVLNDCWSTLPRLHPYLGIQVVSGRLLINTTQTLPMFGYPGGPQRLLINTTKTPPIFGYPGGPWRIVDQRYQDCIHIWVSR